jgi:methionyl-tRNA synthetase
MADPARYFLTTAIDYPNSRPHIGTAFEKLGADVQARYRRMQGHDVFFLMGNDENTVKVSRKAAELGTDPKAYCDDMARQFQEVWKALEVTFDIFVQTSSERHKECCRKFIQKVYDNGHIYKGNYEGWYCEGCEEFKSDKQHAEHNGLCPIHARPLVRRAEECYFFRLSAFQDRLLAYYRENPDFIQPETRRNEMVSLIQNEGLRDINITRTGEDWGIRVPFDERFTIYVWFDALLTYITGIGYGDDRALFDRYWPADVHFIGKDITRFHCALWPAMLWAAGEKAPRKVFSHGFVHIDNEKMSKSLGNIRDPLGIIEKFKVTADVFRYYFLRECPFPSDGNYSDERFVEVYNGDLANNLGNLYSRVMTLVGKNYEGRLEGTRGQTPRPVFAEAAPSFAEVVREIQDHVEACQYNQALQKMWQAVLDPANQYAERREPWKLVKTDREAARQVLFDMVEPLRAVSILLKPFLPRAAETIYRSFNFAKPWEQVRYEDAVAAPAPAEDLRVLAALEGGKVKPLFPRIG